MTKLRIRKYIPEYLIFGFALFIRLFRLNSPNTYVFDEVYHAFTAGQMFKGVPAAWEWWNPNPTGFAYEWTHPPIAKEFMVAAIAVFGDNAFAWRFFSAIFGFGVIVLIYFLAFKLFKNRTIAIVSAFAASMDGLLLVISRIGMNDIFFLFFVLLAFLFFLYNKRFWMGISLGLSLASKWTGLFGIIILLALYVIKLGIKHFNKNSQKKFPIKDLVLIPLFFLIIPLMVYLASYLPFFGGKHVPPGSNQTTFQTFIDLQQQMYWYHTQLKAHHAYQSTPPQWALDLRPVWMYVDYKKDSTASIYALGNPLFMWAGIVSVLACIYDFLKKRVFNLGLIIFGYFGFFIPWIDSPRIMFYYHYLPSVPFLAIGLGYFINKLLKNPRGKIIASIILILIAVLFLYFYPLWTGVHVPSCGGSPKCVSIYDSYFWLPTWK